jgi:hypothetical protein
MSSFALVTTDTEALGMFAYAKLDWKPGDISRKAQPAAA